MTNRIFLVFMVCCAVWAEMSGVSHAKTGASNIVTAAQVNGTWESKSGSFKVLALGKQRLRVGFLGFYEYETPAGPSANTGEGSGIAFIEGDTATFKPQGAEDECLITMKFAKEKLIVTQTGICGFGHNVTATGTYRKKSGSKPEFEDSRK